MTYSRLKTGEPLEIPINFEHKDFWLVSASTLYHHSGKKNSNKSKWIIHENQNYLYIFTAKNSSHNFRGVPSLPRIQYFYCNPLLQEPANQKRLNRILRKQAWSDCLRYQWPGHQPWRHYAISKRTSLVSLPPSKYTLTVELCRLGDRHWWSRSK